MHILWRGAIEYRFPMTKRGNTVTFEGTALLRYIETHDRDNNSPHSWKKFFAAFQETVKELKHGGMWTKVKRGNIFARMRAAYQGLVWRDLSIDLFAAAIRQRSFSEKITSEDCAGIDSPIALTYAISRYHKFMLLLRRRDDGKEKKYQPLVPTLDIDLCWHTHQLHPVEYRAWCEEHLERLINHDDTISKENLKEGLRDTSLAWYEAYREPYTTDDLKKDYLTTGRKVAGILMPLYGLHVLAKSKKLQQSQHGISPPLLWQTTDFRWWGTRTCKS
jgi:Glycine-rich domain-containing protein-like